MTGVQTCALPICQDNAAVLGPYVHGCAGDVAAQCQTKESMMAGDIIKKIAEVMKR